MELYINKPLPIYICGNSYTGKTKLIHDYFENNDLYDCVYLSIQNVDNLDVILSYTNTSIMDIFNKKNRTKIIILDDIDNPNKNEKKIINDIIKYLKTNKKNKIHFKFIFSGINQLNKKIKELMKLCNVIHLKNKNIPNYEKNIQINIQKVISKQFENDFIIENEKATQCLLFHENIIDYLKTRHLSFYYKFLTYYCIGDYYDRISFQKQLWIYNEITYYLKMSSNYYIYKQLDIRVENPKYRFTKILTKFSNEYNNYKFIIELCNEFNISKKKLFLYTKYKSNLFNEAKLKRLRKYFMIET